MRFFETKQKDHYTIIIGCGRLGSGLANAVSDQGGNVLVIDKNRDSFRRLSSGFGGLTITGDCTDLDVLQEAQIDTASVVVAVTEDDNINIMTSLLASDVYHAPRVIARLYDPEKKGICEGHNVYTICPAVLSAQEVDSVLNGLPTEPQTAKKG